MAQDNQFGLSLFNPTTHNPALVGTGEKHRVFVNYRDQWSTIPGSFVTTSLAYDYNSPKSVDFGIYYQNDRSGSSIFENSFQTQFGYEVKMNTVNLRFGVSGGILQRSYEYSSLVFGSQLDANAGYLDQSSGEDIADFSNTQLNVDAGILVYNAAFWFGIGGYHLNRPNLLDQIEVKYQMFTGYTWEYHDFYNSIQFSYAFQGQFDQIKLSYIGLYKSFLYGAGYAGAILKNTYGKANHQSVFFNIGYQLNKVVLSYLFDYDISRLKRVGGNSHEIGVLFNIKKKPKRKTDLHPSKYPFSL